MISLPEAGYTPANLRRLMSDYQLTNRAVAAIVGKHENAIHRWRKDLNQPTHADMSCGDWFLLLKHIQAR